MSGATATAGGGVFVSAQGAAPAFASAEASAPLAAPLAVPEEQGPAGPPGVAGAGSTIVFPQPTPTSTWTLAHGLGRFPSVTLADTTGDQVSADVKFVDENTIKISFGFPTAGVAYLN